MFHPSFTQGGATNPGNPWSQHHGLAPSQPDPQFVTPPQSTYVIPQSAPTRQHVPVHGVSQNQMPPVTLHAPRYHPHRYILSMTLHRRFLLVARQRHRSASGHINIADLGPVPKPFSLLSSGWTDADKYQNINRGGWKPVELDRNKSCWSAGAGAHGGAQESQR
ncbi:hypothetical protein R3P38DRAFT_2809878 [Favolaschia claudopus]|uniref:Uncharacterized protein n=1 Tax=Favolaschia claudopus TaxID=2862362 RepID=A0AAV9ZDA7_9AGAR